MADQDESTWDTTTDDWYVRVRDEMKLKRAIDLLTLQVAAHAIHRVRTAKEAPGDLRLILDALTALRMRRWRWIW